MQKRSIGKIEGNMKEFTCISCPMGCRLQAVTDNGSAVISGNRCARGREYGLQELRDPRRNISSTVRITNGFLECLPVKTAAPIPKGLIFQVMEEINKIRVAAPVGAGAVIIHDVLHTGVDIVACRDMPCSS